ncbi:MAG: acyl-ACP--UDP-N-acetylglucosamine O-acyltransferase [Pirellulales bacterium]
MANNIHPTAVVSPAAHLGNRITIGPFAIVEEDVQLGDDCIVAGRATVKRGAILGADNEIGEGAVVGGRPQHAKITNLFGAVRIGQGNRIRENATIHAAMEKGKFTVIGDYNLLMVNSHVGHDSILGNHTIIVNNVMLGGHTVIEDRAYLGGAAGVHQFCRVGRHAMVGGQAHIVQDVPPFVTVDGGTSRVVGLNRIGLRRHGFTDEQMNQLKQAYRVMYRSGMTWTEVIATLQKTFHEGPAAVLAPFLAVGRRGFVQERRVPRTATLRIPDQLEADETPKGLRRVG